MIEGQAASRAYAASSGMKEFRFLYFSELLKLPVCAGKIKDRIGQVTDLVFRLAEPYPEAVGLYIEHGWGKPTELVPWDKVLRIEDDAVFVAPPPEGGAYAPFVDQPGWILINEHFMGRTILDMDGRQVEVVNDVHLLESKGRVLLVHVEVSLNGFFRKWRLKWLRLGKDRLISWRYVQPLSLEDAGVKDAVSLSVTRKQLKDLPSEDLADVLETLSGEEQQAFFSVLDSEKAAETLMEAEPRAQRQLISNLRRERAQTILSEMSAAQLADLFSVLPHDEVSNLMPLLPSDQAQKIRDILSTRESTASALMSSDYVAFTKDASVGSVMRALRESGCDSEAISYIYVVVESERIVTGVVDLRDMVLADESATLGALMASPVVAAEADDLRDDLVELFSKYHYRMRPVVDANDRILGVVHFNDIMKGMVTRARV